MRILNKYTQYFLSFLLITAITVGLVTTQQLIVADVENENIELFAIEGSEAEDLDTAITHAAYLASHIVNLRNLLSYTDFPHLQFKRYLEARAPPV